jgi:DNA-binding winged helix-turn-helix (wHTH) protein
MHPSDSRISLTLLIENAGEVVTREQIEEQLWTGDSAVSKMRDALGDTSESPLC